MKKEVCVFAFGLVSLCLLPFAALVIQAQWEISHRIVPGPQNRSTFLKGYNPEEVIKKFRYPESFGSGHSSGAGSDTVSVHHNSGFDGEFAIESSRKLELMAALNEDVLRQLALTDTRVVGKSVEPEGGIRYEYVSGNSVGSISVHPPKPAGFHRNAAMPTTVEYVSWEIKLDETWTRPSSQ
jgi:hypothetical protein